MSPTLRKKMNTDFCEKYDMLPRGGIVLCAVSGGKDSMYLLENLRALSSERGFELRCAHFNHRLRGEASNSDQSFVEDWCKARGIACYVGSGDVRAYAEDRHISVEQAARSLRYAFLEETARRIGAARIATAHTADDNAETLLMNLSRGTGLKGLCGIPPVRGIIVRPMLQTTSAEVTRYLEKNGIPHVEDETNASDEYTRNRVRHRVVPELRAAVSGFDASVTRCISNLREDEEYLSGLAGRFMEDNYSDGSLPAAETAALPAPVSARVLKAAAGSELSQKHIEALRSLAASADAHGCVDVTGMRVYREYDRLVFGGEAGSFRSVTLKAGESARLEELGVTALCEVVPAGSEVYNLDNTFLFAIGSICGSITLRPRADGDKIRLAGRNCTKSLNKLFAENRLKDLNQGRIIVLSDEKGVIAVQGLGIAERCAVQEGGEAVRVRLTEDILQRDK